MKKGMAVKIAEAILIFLPFTFISVASARDISAECADISFDLKTAARAVKDTQQCIDHTKAAAASSELAELQDSLEWNHKIFQHADVSIAAVEKYLMNLQFLYNNHCLPGCYDKEMKDEIDHTTSELSDLKDENMSKYDPAPSAAGGSAGNQGATSGGSAGSQGGAGGGAGGSQGGAGGGAGGNQGGTSGGFAGSQGGNSQGNNSEGRAAPAPEMGASIFGLGMAGALTFYVVRRRRAHARLSVRHPAGLPGRRVGDRA
jgi:hypothetical protein